MKINEIICERQQVDEIAPLIAAIGSGLGAAARGAAALGGAALRGAGALGSAALDATGAAARGIGTAAADAGGAAVRGVGNVANRVGTSVVNKAEQTAVNKITSMGSSKTPAQNPTPTSNDAQAKKLSQQQIQANLKGVQPGTKFAYPEIGQVEVLPQQAGQQGLRLRIPKVGDVTVDPKDLTNLANNLPK
jgi:hypothetical protein